MVTKLRCKICEFPHKNTARCALWLERQVCRICGNLLELFSWNGNYLKDYWEDTQTKQSLNVNTDQKTKYQDITYFKYDRNEVVKSEENKHIDFMKAMSEMESLDWQYDGNYIGFANNRINEVLQFIRLEKNKWYAEVPINPGKLWDGYYWSSYHDNKTISEILRLFFEEMPWFGMIQWKMRRYNKK